jgi:RNA polymerase sigma-70 factor (ECF subfamily)
VLHLEKKILAPAGRNEALGGTVLVSSSASGATGAIPRVVDTDADLVARARRGDEAAFQILAERYAPTLHRLACSLAGNVADAEDAVQETLLGAYRQIGSFEGRSSFKTWVSRILVNQTARQRRSKRVREAVKPVDFSDASKALLKGLEKADGTRDSEIRMDVLAALNGMSSEFRDVIVLREMEGLSYLEIADVLGVPRGTVESRLHRARAELKELLKEYMR